MRHSTSKSKRGRAAGTKAQARYTVGLQPAVAHQVQQYARTIDASMSDAIGRLVRLGLDRQESRKREFFDKLKANLANDDSKQQDQLIDEFRDLILGR